MTATPPKKSDLGTRTLSAIVMVAVAGTALWLGGWVWTAFVALVALGVLWEWCLLTFAISKGAIPRALWVIVGVSYIGLAFAALTDFRLGMAWIPSLIVIVGAVIATDIGAYFAGRTIGGPKIAPNISPSKTWAGLVGGIVLATLFLFSANLWDAYQLGRQLNVPVDFFRWRPTLYNSAALGSTFAVIAQAGDFFESWMKRKAGVKDSGKLIPGHGGLFDRVDGLLAIAFGLGCYFLFIDPVFS